MNFKRIGRMLVCLVLVCCLIVNISPVRAEASALATLTPVLVEGAKVVAVALAGVGIAAGVANTDFDALTDNLVDYYTEQGVINSDGLMSLYSLGDGAYGIDATILQGLFDWAWDNEVVTSSAPSFASNITVSYGSNSNITFDSNGTFIVVAARCYYGSGSWDWLGFVSESSCKVGPNSYNGYAASTLAKQDSGLYVAGSANGTNIFGTPVTPSSNITFAEINCSSFSEAQTAVHNYPWLSAGEITTDKDLTLGEVAVAGSTLSDGYSAWTANAVSGTNEDGENVLVYPIGTTAVGDEELVYSQEEVQAGTVPFVIVVDQTGTGGDSTEPTEPDTGEGTVVPTDPITPSLLERLFGGVTDKLDATIESIQEIPEILRELWQDLKTGLEELPSKFAEWFNNIQTALEKLVTGQITLADLLSGLIEPVKTAITQALTALFAPSETFISTKVNELCAKYPYLDIFLGLGADLKAYFLSLGTQAPIIYIDLSAATGSYYLGGKEVFLDLTWYAEYKPTMDNIIGAFIWLWLAWRVFLSLPSLIQGGNGFWGEHKTDIGAGPTVNPTIVHQRELPPGRGLRRNE